MPTDSQLRLAVKPQLEPHEELLWVGHPNPNRIVFKLSDIIGFLVGIFFLGTFIVPPSKIGLNILTFFSLFFIFYPLINFANSYIRALKTIYVLTNKRALIISTSNLKHSIQSYSSTDIGIIERIELKNGSGDLIFAQKLYKDSEGGWQKEDVKFVGIQKVKFVENLFHQVFNK